MKIIAVILAIICLFETICIIGLRQYLELTEETNDDKRMDFVLLGQLSERIQAIEIELARRERENNERNAD